MMDIKICPKRTIVDILEIEDIKFKKKMELHFSEKYNLVLRKYLNKLSTVSICWELQLQQLANSEDEL